MFVKMPHCSVFLFEVFGSVINVCSCVLLGGGDKVCV